MRRVIDGKYRIEWQIGSGGMGDVYAGVMLNSGRKVAIKVLSNRNRDPEKNVMRFHREAYLARFINHPHICEVLDHGCTEEGTPYLVMPLLCGRSLESILMDAEQIDIGRVVTIAQQTLHGLAAVHEKAIVHRDLKPSNIFVIETSYGEDHVKLIDFGISKLLETDAYGHLTTTGRVMGTAYYLAPEQAFGRKHIDHRVDIYAMGVILYQALTGRRPFEGTSYNEIISKITGIPFRHPRDINPDIPHAVEKVVLTAMSFDPCRRFSTAKEMNDALTAAAEKVSDRITPLNVEPLTETERMEDLMAYALRSKRRRRLLLGGGGASVGLLAAGLAAWFLFAKNAPTVEPRISSGIAVSDIDRPRRTVDDISVRRSTLAVVPTIVNNVVSLAPIQARPEADDVPGHPPKRKRVGVRMRNRRVDELCDSRGCIPLP